MLLSANGSAAGLSMAGTAGAGLQNKTRAGLCCVVST